jgi:putative addiction module component (TIGR02574 family)
MSEATAQLLSKVLALPIADRLELLDALSASLAPPRGSNDSDPDFDATLQRRIDELESGRVKGVPAEEVLERLRKKYAQ